MLNRIQVALVAALLTANAAWAGSVFEDAPSACTAINCGAMSIRGIHQANEPFVIQVFAAEGECLRLDVDSQTQDTALLLAGPTVLDAYVADDRDDLGGDFRPLMLYDPIPATGWYTVAVSYWDFGPLVSKFVLKYGRYPGGNPNCVFPAAASARSLTKLPVNPQKTLSRSGTSPAKTGRED